mgnify:CR=1 FL=1
MIEALYEGLPAHVAGIGEFDIITEAERTTLENEYRYKEE